MEQGGGGAGRTVSAVIGALRAIVRAVLAYGARHTVTSQVIGYATTMCGHNADGRLTVWVDMVSRPVFCSGENRPSSG